MNEIVATHPHREMHVILDNLNTHKPQADRWLQRHPQVHFHLTPTYASWINQVECWFSILSRQAFGGVSFPSPHQVPEASHRFVAAYHPKAPPFEWKKDVVRTFGAKTEFR